MTFQGNGNCNRLPYDYDLGSNERGAVIGIQNLMNLMLSKLILIIQEDKDEDNLMNLI